jgi:hypothetical protein
MIAMAGTPGLPHPVGEIALIIHENSKGIIQGKTYMLSAEYQVSPDGNHGFVVIHTATFRKGKAGYKGCGFILRKIKFQVGRKGRPLPGWFNVQVQFYQVRIKPIVNSKVKAVTAARYRRIGERSREFPCTKRQGFAEYEAFPGFFIPQKHLGKTVIFYVTQDCQEKVGFILYMKGLPFLNPQVPDPLHGWQMKGMLNIKEVHIIKGSGPGTKNGYTLFYGTGTGRGNISLVH